MAPIPLRLRRSAPPGGERREGLRLHMPQVGLACPHKTREKIHPPSSAEQPDGLSRPNLLQSRYRDAHHPEVFRFPQRGRSSARAPTPSDVSLSATSRKRRRPCSSHPLRHASSIRVRPTCMPASSLEPAFLTLATFRLPPNAPSTEAGYCPAPPPPKPSAPPASGAGWLDSDPGRP